MTRSVIDQCIYYKHESNKIIYIAVYVDDILIISNSQGEEEAVVRELSSNFRMKDLGEAKTILGFSIKRNKNYRTISLSQKRYIEDILSKYGMGDCKPVTTPIDINQKISKEMCAETEEEIKEMKKNTI